MRIIYFSFLITCLAWKVNNVYAQNFSHIKHYTTDDGLPHNVGYKLMQDSKGFLWICTDDGLARFDGKSFKVYRSRDGLLSNYPIDIAEAKDGTLWIGSWKGGVNYLKNDSVYTPVIDHPLFRVANIDIQGDNMMLSNGKASTYFYQNKGNRWQSLNIPENNTLFLKNDSIISYHELNVHRRLANLKPIRVAKAYLTTDQSKLVFGGFAGVWTYQNDSTFTSFFPEVIQKDTVYHITQDTQQKYWLGGRGKLWVIDSSGQAKTWTKNLPPYRIHNIKQGIDGKIYFLTGLENLNNRGFYSYDLVTRQLENLMTKYRLRAFPSNLEIDQEGSLWFTTNGDGLYCITYSPFQNYDQQQGLADEFVQHIQQDKYGNIYLGTNNGLYKYQSLRFNQVALLPNESSTDVTQLYLNSRGNLMVLGNVMLLAGYQLFEIDQAQRVRMAVLDRDIGKHWFEESRDKVWYYGDNTLALKGLKGKVDKQKWLLKRFPKNFLILHLFNYESKLWMATNQGLYAFKERRQNDTLMRVDFLDSLKVSNGLPSNFVSTVAKGQQGELWIGTKEGLCRYKNGKIQQWGVEDGLISNNCSSVLVDHQGHLWVGTSKGLSYFDGQKFTNYNHKTGLISPSINCLFLDKRNHLWIGTSKGISVIDISQKPRLVTAPGLYIEKILVNRKTIDINSEITLKYNQRLDIRFQTLTFVHPEGVRYQHRLNGESWEGTRRNFLNYNRLPTGTHMLEVRSRKYNSDWSTIKRIRIEVIPPFWLTWWAFSTYAIVLILGVYLIIRWRSRKLIKDKLRLERLVAKRTYELEQQKEEIISQAEQLKEMDQVKSRFFANISHEFKTPLTLIMGPAEKLLGLKIQPFKTYSEYVMANAQRLMKLINQLMDVSKLDSGKLPLQMNPGNLTTFLGQVFHSFELLAQQKEVQMELQTSNEDILCEFDEDKIEKIFFNLLSNALKFTPVQGKIVFSLEQLNGQLKMIVSDNGTGIPADQLPFIFDRFYQADASGTRAYEGTGIGLALVKELVDLHKGTIEVTSELNQGTTFTVQLPLVQTSPHYLTTGSSANATTPDMAGLLTTIIPEDQMPVNEAVTPEKNTVLIVEDNVEISAFIAAELKPFYEVLLARNGEEGIELALKHVPDLVISDVMMPRIDGLEMVKKLRANEVTNHISVIILSAKSDFESKIAGLETGGDDYLTKPFSAKELLLRVKNMLERRDRLREAFARQISMPVVVTATPKKRRLSPEEAFLKKVTEIVEQNIDNLSLDIPFFCQEIGMSHSNLFRKMKALTGMSIVQFIRTIRLKKAATLIRETEDKVEDIALQVGFNDVFYFNKCFKKQFGVNPSKYQ